MTRFVIHNHIPSKRARDANYLNPKAGAQPVDLLLADTLRPRGEWQGPYVPSATAGFVQAPGSKGYVPYYNPSEPHARKLLGKRPSQLFRAKDRAADGQAGRAVERGEEERLRDRAYQDTGITRVGRDYRTSRDAGSGYKAHLVKGGWVVERLSDQARMSIRNEDLSEKEAIAYAKASPSNRWQ